MKKNITRHVNHVVNFANSDGSISLLLRYGLAGLFVGFFYVLIGYVLTEFLNLIVPVSVTLAYIVTTPIAFYLQKKFTFRSNSKLSKEIPRFIIVAVLLLIFSTLTNEFVSLPVPMTVQLIFFWFLGSLLNFLGYKFWVFHGAK